MPFMQEKELGAEEMLAGEILALQEQLAGFIMDEIVSEQGEFNIMKV
jgi:hypothetical protein